MRECRVCMCVWGGGVAKTKLAPQSKLTKQPKEVGIYVAYGISILMFINSFTPI